MSLMDIAVGYGGFPGGNRSKKMQDGEMPPMRGHMPWNSGFQGYERIVAEERRRLLEMIMKQQAEMSLRHSQVPIADYKKRA